MKFTEAQLEAAIIHLLRDQGFPHLVGKQLARSPEEVLLEDDLRAYLLRRYAREQLTEGEIQQVLRQLRGFSTLSLYESNKAFSRLLTDGFILKREDPRQKDLYLQLLDTRALGATRLPDPKNLTQIGRETQDVYASDHNLYKVVNQMEIQGPEHLRIPDLILYINGLPLVVMEFKSAIREEATLYQAYRQLTNRYRRDIPALFVYNAFCVLSDGVNTKAGSFFANYEHYYAWRRVESQDEEVDGIPALDSLIRGMLRPHRLLDIVQNFIYLPDSSRKEEKILCRYPQYFAARKLFENIKEHQRPAGDGKGGTYFGATGSGKSYTMLFLSRLLMKSLHFNSPTLLLITDRTDLDEQLSQQFAKAKHFLGDQTVVSVQSRDDLRQQLQGRNSGGVFLTTIHKFTEDTQLLTERTNVICISDEAHRSQVNLQQKVKVTKEGVTKTYGFAKYLHDSLPNATYVGFTGTPVDATLQVFGPVVDAYTMTESVADEITVRIVYEGRAAKVLLDQAKLQEIEAYYAACAEEGANEHQIEASKQAMAQMKAIIGDRDRLRAIAADFVAHYERRVAEGASVKGKALFVSSSREIAYALFQEIIALRPAWNEPLLAEEGAELSERERKKLKPIERIKMVMTRSKDDDKALFRLLGNKAHRKELDRQFKQPKSNFKIALVVDMWLTGFDVPHLDTLYLDKPVQRHSLIQTISRVNRKVEGKEKGLVVDYLGIKQQMNQALAHYTRLDHATIEEVQQSVVVVRDHLDLLDRLFHRFDAAPYFTDQPLAQLHTLNLAQEYVQQTQELEQRFMGLVKRLKAAYDLCVSSDVFDTAERDQIGFYLAVRSLLAKLTRGDAPDAARMNVRVQEMIEAAIQSQGVEEIYRLDEQQGEELDLFDADYLAQLDQLKLPHTKLKLLQKLLAKAIEQVKRTNRVKGIDFSQRMQSLVQRYNQREEAELFQGQVLDELTEGIMELLQEVQEEMGAHVALGVDVEEKAFYDLLNSLVLKYGFVYPENRLMPLAKAVKQVVDQTAQYTDWSRRTDLKAQLKVDLILLLADHGYPPVDRDEVYDEVFAQAEAMRG